MAAAGIAAQISPAPLILEATYPGLDVVHGPHGPPGPPGPRGRPGPPGVSVVNLTDAQYKGQTTKNACTAATLCGNNGRGQLIDMTDPGSTYMSWEPDCHCPAFRTYVQVVPHQSWLHFIDLPSTPQYVCHTMFVSKTGIYTQIGKWVLHTNTETGMQYIQEWVPTDMAMGIRQSGYGLYCS